MAGLSIIRRRKAWFKGIIFGAIGRGKCPFTVPKLKEIFVRGTVHGRTNANSGYVRALVEQEQRRRAPRVTPTRPPRPGFRPGSRSGSRFDRPGPGNSSRFF